MDATETRKPRKERKENADRRRRQLLDAAFRSIVANGLARTTLATVAAEAGLSQGVVVFYFKSKNGLLAAAMQDLYQTYEANWVAAVEAAGDDPLDRLIAMIGADFDKEICNPETLSVWYAFWGEQKFTPQYAEVSNSFEERRSMEIVSICSSLLPDEQTERARQIGFWVDTLTDGFWQQLHLFPETCSREQMAQSTMEFLAALLTEHSDRLIEAP